MPGATWSLLPWVLRMCCSPRSSAGHGRWFACTTPATSRIRHRGVGASFAGRSFRWRRSAGRCGCRNSAGFVESTQHALLDPRLRQRTRGTHRGLRHCRVGIIAPAVDRRPGNAWCGPAGHRLPHVRPGDGRPNRSRRKWHRRDRVRVSFAGCRSGGNPQHEQCAQRSRVVDRRGDLHRSADGRQQPRRSHRPPRIHGRERGECSWIVGDDGREPSRRPRTGCRFDHGGGQQCHFDSRSGGQRVDSLTTVHCRPVASRLQQQRAVQTDSATPF